MLIIFILNNLKYRYLLKILCDLVIPDFKQIIYNINFMDFLKLQPITNQPQSYILLDFITNLLISNSYNSILMTRDCIIKRAHFIHFTIIVGEETTFFFDDIYQYYRLLIYIILTFNIIKIPYSINFLTIFSMDFNNGNQIFIFDLI